MTNITLAQSYLVRSRTRLKVLDILCREGAYADVVRESQEIVELALKGILRQIGIEPPKQHDVGPLLLEYEEMLPSHARRNVAKLAAVSKWLRKEREFAFYGDVDFIPDMEYSKTDAEKAIEGAILAVECASMSIPAPD